LKLDKIKVLDWIMSIYKTELESLEPNTEAYQKAERQMLVYRFMPRRILDSSDIAAVPNTIVVGALVHLRHESRDSLCLLIPSGGGWVTSFEGTPLQILTPQSPLGEAMTSKKKGERFFILSHQKKREYEIIDFQ
jgi:hypothetical protein